MMSPNLTTMYKGHYPFRLACPSFIYPAGYVDNVRFLGDCVDEIELLLLENAPECLPSKNEIKELAILGDDCGITYNIHLPADVSPGAGDPVNRNAAVEGLLRAIDRSRPLTPILYTLHVPFTAPSDSPDNLTDWQHRVRESLTRLLAESDLPARDMTIETLDYPLQYLDPVIRELGFSICLDTGHLMVRGQSCKSFYLEYEKCITAMHIHGVENSRDHLALNRLSPVQSQEIGHILQNFCQSVSLEVFSVTDLSLSLDYLDRIWKNLSQLNND